MRRGGFDLPTSLFDNDGGAVVGSRYLNYNYLRMAPNVPKQVIASIVGNTGKQSKSRLKRQLVAKKAEKYRVRVKKRKQKKKPSVKQVRKDLKDMVDYLKSQHEKQFASIFPISVCKGDEKQGQCEEDSESDSDSDIEGGETSSSGGAGKKGISDLRRKDLKKLGKRLHDSNKNIPCHRL